MRLFSLPLLLFIPRRSAAAPPEEEEVRLFERMRQLSVKYKLNAVNAWDRAHTNDRHISDKGTTHEIFKPHIGGDKFEVDGHRANYSGIYAEILAPHAAAAEPIVFVEAGIFRGESLAVWADLLPTSTVVGVDGNVGPFAHALPRLYDKGAFNRGVPHVIQGTSVQAATRVANSSVDVFVDDAGHNPRAQIETFRAWRQKMRWESGTYVVEDVLSIGFVRSSLASIEPALHFCSHGYAAILYARTQPISNCADWCHQRCPKPHDRCSHCETMPFRNGSRLAQRMQRHHRGATSVDRSQSPG